MIELPELASPSRLFELGAEKKDQVIDAGKTALRGLAGRIVDATWPKHEMLSSGAYPKFRVGKKENSLEFELSVSENDIQRDLDSGRD